MEALQRDQVQRVIDFESDNARRSLADRIDAVLSEHSAKGRLRSGATIVVTLQRAEEVLTAAIAEMVRQVRSVALDYQAFTALQAGLSDLLLSLRGQLDTVVNLAAGDATAAPSAYSDATRRFDEIKFRASQRLGLHMLEFTLGPASASLAPTATPSASASSEPTRNKGGRPLAQHWDDLWAHIAAKLYLTDWNPKTQQAVEEAMSEWLVNHSLDAAESTVRGRARRLWDQIAE